MPTGQAVQRLAGEILLNDLALERDAVGAVGSVLCGNGGAKLVHGSGGIVSQRAEQDSAR